MRKKTNCKKEALQSAKKHCRGRKWSIDLRRSLFHHHFRALCRCPPTFLHRQSHVSDRKDLKGSWTEPDRCLTVAREVTEAYVILLHESLGANQIREGSVHVQILKENMSRSSQRDDANTATLLSASGAPPWAPRLPPLCRGLPRPLNPNSLLWCPDARRQIPAPADRSSQLPASLGLTRPLSVLGSSPLRETLNRSNTTFYLWSSLEHKAPLGSKFF